MTVLKLISFLLLTILPSAVFGGELVISGVYQGKNLYVQNPFIPGTEDFCTQQVYINDELVISSPRTSAFVVDLSGFSINQSVIVKIMHSDVCEPKIINPQVIRREANFRYTALSLTEDRLTWSTTGEMPNSRFFIEQYMNNRWVIVKSVVAKGRYDQNSYEYTPSIGSGDNLIRIKNLTPQGEVIYSDLLKYTSDKPPVTFTPEKVTDMITLSREVKYSVFDAQGNLLFQGNGDKVDCKDLESGQYYINFDNRTRKFTKR